MEATATEAAKGHKILNSFVVVVFSLSHVSSSSLCLFVRRNKQNTLPKPTTRQLNNKPFIYWSIKWKCLRSNFIIWWGKSKCCMRSVQVSNRTRVLVWLISIKLMRITQVNKSIDFQDENAFVASVHWFNLNEASFPLAVIAHSTLQSMLLQAKHYVTDRRFVAIHRVNADVRYRWRPMPKPIHKGWKASHRGYYFRIRCIYCLLFLLCSGLLLHVDRRRHSLRLLVRDFPFSQVNLFFFYCLTCHTNWHRYFTIFFFSFSPLSSSSRIRRHIIFSRRLVCKSPKRKAMKFFFQKERACIIAKLGKKCALRMV